MYCFTKTSSFQWVLSYEDMLKCSDIVDTKKNTEKIISDGKTICENMNGTET